MAYSETVSTRRGSFFESAGKRLALWRRNWRTRRQLADLPPWMLKDVGITPRQAREEARRLF